MPSRKTMTKTRRKTSKAASRGRSRKTGGARKTSGSTRSRRKPAKPIDMAGQEERSEP